MVRAKMGLNWGSMKSAARPATPMAHSTAMITSSLVWGFLPSKTMAKGAMHSSRTNRATK